MIASETKSNQIDLDLDTAASYIHATDHTMEIFSQLIDAAKSASIALNSTAQIRDQLEGDDRINLTQENCDLVNRNYELEEALTTCFLALEIVRDYMLDNDVPPEAELLRTALLLLDGTVRMGVDKEVTNEGGI